MLCCGIWRNLIISAYFPVASTLFVSLDMARSLSRKGQWSLQFYICRFKQPSNFIHVLLRMEFLPICSDGRSTCQTLGLIPKPFTNKDQSLHLFSYQKCKRLKSSGETSIPSHYPLHYPRLPLVDVCDPYTTMPTRRRWTTPLYFEWFSKCRWNEGRRAGRNHVDGYSLDLPPTQ